ncbi:MAG: ABC-2 family transporter protein [Anaerolineae bacterium]|nr:ABC-2 family transporter protein [Anaerolineae bacterium]
MIAHPLRVFVRLARGSLMTAMEYRVGFITALGMSLIDALWAVGGAWVFYSHRPTLGGWRFHEALLVVGLFFIASGFLDAVLQPSLRELIEGLRTGQLDYILIRPMDAMLLISMRRQRFEKLSSALIGVVLIAVGLSQASAVGGAPLFGFLVLLGFTLLLLYAAMSLLMALCFWVVDLTNIEELLLGLLETARYPVQAFPEPLRSVLSFVLPIAFISTVPAEMLLGRPNWLLIAYGIAATLALFALSRLAWRAALRKYASIGG